MCLSISALPNSGVHCPPICIKKEDNNSVHHLSIFTDIRRQRVRRWGLSLFPDVTSPRACLPAWLFLPCPHAPTWPPETGDGRNGARLDTDSPRADRRGRNGTLHFRVKLMFPHTNTRVYELRRASAQRSTPTLHTARPTRDTRRAERNFSCRVGHISAILVQILLSY